MTENKTQDSLSRLCVIILAAGQGKRMKSSESKVFFPFLGKSLIGHILDAVNSLSPHRIIAVVSPLDLERAQKTYGSLAEFVVQSEAKGTGDAVQKAWEIAPSEDCYMILCGDTPLIQDKTLLSLFEVFDKTHSDVALISARVEQAKMYGRIIRDSTGNFQEIVEFKDATPEEKLIQEVNAGMYLFKHKALESTLYCLNNKNAAKEIYLTDTLKDIRQQGGIISLYTLDNEEEILGINNRKDLSTALSIVYRRKNEHLMLEDGVTIIDPDNTFIDPRVEIGSDSIIKPFCYLEGPITIGTNVDIGPYVCMRAGEKDPIIIEAGCRVGPFSSLRGGTHLKENAHVGTYVEMKKSTLGKKSKAMHLSYLGDAEIGHEVNIGAGTITCNYDGEQKYKTTIEDRVFVGSDAILVAPLNIGHDSYIAAGSTITQDVPDHSLGLGRSRQINKTGWRKRSIQKTEEPSLSQKKEENHE
jgi:bifunctional UDP-N-acetylglucosamine pyrophosphorylase / glucosamine-1-phosphate N-acetyltransferase